MDCLPKVRYGEVAVSTDDALLLSHRALLLIFGRLAADFPRNPGSKASTMNGPAVSSLQQPFVAAPTRPPQPTWRAAGFTASLGQLTVIAFSQRPSFKQYHSSNGAHLCNLRPEIPPDGLHARMPRHRHHLLQWHVLPPGLGHEARPQRVRRKILSHLRAHTAPSGGRAPSSPTARRCTIWGNRPFRVD